VGDLSGRPHGGDRCVAAPRTATSSTANANATTPTTASPNGATARSPLTLKSNVSAPAKTKHHATPDASPRPANGSASSTTPAPNAACRWSRSRWTTPSAPHGASRWTTKAAWNGPSSPPRAAGGTGGSPGPCNRAYRKAVDNHETAKVIHDHALTHHHEQAIPAYEAAYAWWQHHADAGVLVVREPAKPQPPIEPAEPTITHNVADPAWCSRCTGLIRAALANLDDLASLLDSWADGHRGATASQKYGTTGHRAHPGSPSPIGDTLDELYGLLVRVEDDWREYRCYERRPNRARDARARRLTLAFLASELNDILNNAGSVRFGLGVLAWERRLQDLTTSEPVIQRRPARCPNDRCRQRALWTRADGMTECRNCGWLLHEHEYGELVARDDGSVDRKEARAS
jgi:hypothetical protein